LSCSIARKRTPSTAVVSTDRIPTCKNPAICSSFVLDLTLAVGAVGILVSFTDGL
jgi:hypothetical protein